MDRLHLPEKFPDCFCASRHITDRIAGNDEHDARFAEFRSRAAEPGRGGRWTQLQRTVDLAGVEAGIDFVQKQQARLHGEAFREFEPFAVSKR